ncbi:Aminoglycoside phosphotransferase [Penicillium herquei]|nr:Aminoglycoside phosphotransferase [Penicillium herquei]
MELAEGELTKRMRWLVKEGLLGTYQGKAVLSDVIRQDEKTITFIVALYDLISEQIGERHLVCITKDEGRLVSTTHITLTKEELDRIFTDANIGTPQDITRLGKGSYGVSYKVSVVENPKQYIVQLRYHGNIDSMNKLIGYIYDHAAAILPVPKPVPTTVQVSSDLGVPISQFIEGVPGNEAYYDAPIDEKVDLVRQIARAFGTLWSLQIDRPQNLIGEAIFSGEPISISVGPDRKYKLGGPFASISEYLKAWIHHCVRELEATELVEEFKDDVLPGIRGLVEDGLEIPPEVEEVPIVVSHADMELYNMIFSSSEPRKLQALLDWELVYCLPFAVAVPMFVEPLFWEDLKGNQKDGEDRPKLREAFWDEIPQWKEQIDSKAARTFLEWYEFGRNMDVFPPLEDDTTPEQRRELWKENTRCIREFLKSHCISEHL